MTVEGLRGSPRSSHLLFTVCRPHPGQEDAARNILRFLVESNFVRDDDDEATSLRRDRYSIRTAAQWMGPSLEDLSLARTQLLIVCTTSQITPSLIVRRRVGRGKGATFRPWKRLATPHTSSDEYFYATGRAHQSSHQSWLPPNLVVDEPSRGTFACCMRGTGFTRNARSFLPSFGRPRPLPNRGYMVRPRDDLYSA
nr:phenylalanine aminomutase (l-beta-phenylalanine forming) [Quercus suber]